MLPGCYMFNDVYLLLLICPRLPLGGRQALPPRQDAGLVVIVPAWLQDAHASCVEGGDTSWGTINVPTLPQPRCLAPSSASNPAPLLLLQPLSHLLLS